MHTSLTEDAATTVVHAFLMSQVDYVNSVLHRVSAANVEPHNCDESRGDGEVKLACGCMLPVVAGALSPDGQLKLKQWQTQMVPCSRGRINGMRTIVMRDTGSTTCVVKKSLVKPEQMTGSYELCMLTDGIVKHYPTAMMELDTPYFIGKT